MQGHSSTDSEGRMKDCGIGGENFQEGTSAILFESINILYYYFISIYSYKYIMYNKNIK